MASLSHIGIYVTDLEKTKDFFVRIFGGVPNSLYHNPESGFSSYFIRFADDTLLEIMHLAETKKRDAEITDFTGCHHICFSLGDKRSVDEMAIILAENGCEIKKGPRLTGDGHYECLCSVFGEILVEICDK